MLKVVPTESKYAQITDCRYVTLIGTFYNLTHDERDSLVRDYYVFLNEMLSSSCIMAWSMDKQAVKDIDVSLSANTCPSLSLNLEGKVPGEVIYNKTTMRKLMRKRMYDLAFSQGLAPMHASLDYVYKRIYYLDRYQNDPEIYAEKLYDFFGYDLPYIQQYEVLDVYGNIHSRALNGESQLLSGCFTVRISYACLNGLIDDAAELLLGFAQAASGKYVNVNASIGPETQGGFSEHADYEFYYSFQDTVEGSKIGRDFLFATDYVYAKRPGWANILSPITNTLNNCKTQYTVDATKIVQKKLSHGGGIIKNLKPMSQTTGFDYLEIKKAMYGMLRPGEKTITIDPDPILHFSWLRTRWERVPVLAEELSLGEDGIHICYSGTVDLEMLSELFKIPLSLN